MERKKEVLTVGAMAVVLALLLRFFALAAPENGAFLTLLVYLQTGHLVRYSQSVTPVTTTPAPKPEIGLQFTAGDVENVQFYDFTATTPDLREHLLSPLNWDLTGENPTVLILHTHATESYTPSPGEIYEESSDYRTLNPSYNMLSIGDAVAQALMEQVLSVASGAQPKAEERGYRQIAIFKGGVTL